jgi:sugar O-acyltransferase (sialic acid O-acetyltransferase NeuD family)
MSNPILVPLLNPNEPEALLANLYIAEGQQVAVDDLICTLETTKSTADVPAEFSGYVVALQVTEGQTLHAGALICYLAETPDWTPPQAESDFQDKNDPAQISDGELPAGVRITRPALKLAREKGFDLNQLPVGPMITGSMLQNLLEKTSPADVSLPQSNFDPTKILIHGCGGHGKACLDLLRMLGSYQVIGFIDDNTDLAGENLMGLRVLGGSEKLAELHTQGVRLAVNAVGGIGNVAVRAAVFRKLAAAGFACPAIVHPTAFVEASALLSPGVQVFPHAYIGSEARVGFGSIVNTGAIVSHDCRLGIMVNISPGAILAGEVTCEDRVLVGMGATINLQVRVGVGARIGNGATVKSDLPKNGIVRAGGIWPN